MALEQSGVQLVAQGADAFSADMKAATAATNTFVSTTEKGSGAVSKSGQIMIGALREVGKLATQAFLEAGKAMVGFVGDSVKVAGDFEAGMHKFQAVAGSAVDTRGLEKFKDLFISLGKELPVSTSEVEQAAIEMVSGGIDPAIVQAGALRSTIQFAAASGLSLADAAATSAKFLAGWTSSAATTAEKVDFLTTSTDALTKAAAASSTTAAELRLGIFNVQGAAQALHAPFTDVVATLAELAPAFESSAQAGTALNVFMTRLEPQTDKAAGAMKDLGIITKEGRNLFFDAQGSFLGMGNAAEVLKQKLGGLTDQQKISTLHELFGNDAMKVGNLLMQDGAAGIDAMKQKMDEANGVQATAALMQSGYNTALENAKGSVEALQITLGSKLLPILTDLLNNYIAPAINAFTDWAGAILDADDPLLALSNAIDTALPGFNEFASFVENLSSELAAGDWGGAFDTIVQGIGDLGATIGPPLIDALDTAMNMAFDWIASQAPAWLDQLGVWGEQLAEWVVPMIPLLIDSLTNAKRMAFDWIASQAPDWLGQLKIWGEQFVAWIAPMIPPFLVELGKMAQDLFAWIAAQAAPLITKFLAWKDAFIAWIPGATVTFLQEWPKMFDQFLNWIGSQAGPLLAKFGDWVLSFIGWIVPMIPGFLATLGAVVIALGAWVIETAAVLSNKIINTWLPALVGWIITDAIPKLGMALNEFLKVIKGWSDDAQHDLVVWMLDVGKSLVDGIKQGISDAWGSFTHWIHEQMMKIPKAVRDALGISSPSQEMIPIGEFAVQGIMVGFQNMWPNLMSLVSGLSDDLVKQVSSIADDVQNAMADAFGATASIDRQKINNLKAVAGLSDINQAGVQGQLNAVEQEAMAMTDPKQAQEWFQLRSKQMIELAKLNDQIEAETDKKQKERLLAQYQLVNAANNAEIKQFEAKAQTGNATTDLIDQIQKMLNNAKMPGILNDPVVAQLAHFLDLLRAPHMASGGDTKAGNPYWVGEDGPELFWPKTQGTVMPAATSAQLASAGSTTVYNNTTNNSMPVYSNNSVGALQQSFAVMQAGMI